MYYLYGIDLAHLDITSSNIMLRKEGYGAWDQLRLLDFGFAHHCNKGEALCMHSRLTPCCRSVLLKVVPPSCASNKYLCFVLYHRLKLLSATLSHAVLSIGDCKAMSNQVC